MTTHKKPTHNTPRIPLWLTCAFDAALVIIAVTAILDVRAAHAECDPSDTSKVHLNPMEVEVSKVPFKPSPETLKSPNSRAGFLGLTMEEKALMYDTCMAESRIICRSDLKGDYDQIDIKPYCALIR